MTTCPSPSASKPAHGARPKDTPADARCIEDFARALRDKGGLADQTCEPDDEPALLAAGEPAPTLAPCAAAPFAAKLMAVRAAAGSTAAVDALPRATHAELAAAAPPGSPAARSFQVSLNEPLGLPVSLRATQEAAPAGSGARWSLSITSTSLNPAQLGRYSERLDLRLRSRALSHEPVRIEDDEPPP